MGSNPDIEEMLKLLSATLGGVFPEKSFLVFQVQGRATTQKVIFE